MSRNTNDRSRGRHAPGDETEPHLPVDDAHAAADHTGGGTNSDNSQRSLPFLSLAALGVVYGDIGTSPIYALRQAFS